MKLKKSFLSPTYEIKLLDSGYDAVIGIDEAGRGPWAGPVSIAAYIFTKEAVVFEGINDSKKLRKQERADRFQQIANSKESSKFINELVSSEDIDNIGIGNVIENSIQSLMDKVTSIEEFGNKKLIFLIDGYFTKKFTSEYELVKGGDRKSYSIAAASIIAKFKRDEIMQKFALDYPMYGFEKHVGYGTAFHRINLEKYGPCPIHRLSYKPVAKIAERFKLKG